jgi:hypothetical protein
MVPSVVNQTTNRNRQMSKLSNLKLDARQILIASLPSDLPDSFFCPPPAVKTESACALAVPADSEQAGGIHSIYATFLEHSDSFLKEIRQIWSAQDELDALRISKVLSFETWIDCKYALRLELNARVQAVTNFGLLPFLV